MNQMLYDARKKSLLVAYLLLFFFGALGIHRLYTGNSVSGFLMPVFTMLAVFVSVGSGKAWPVLVAAGWYLLDFILVIGLVQDANVRLAEELSTDNAA